MAQYRQLIPVGEVWVTRDQSHTRSATRPWPREIRPCGLRSRLGCVRLPTVSVREVWSGRAGEVLSAAGARVAFESRWPRYAAVSDTATMQIREANLSDVQAVTAFAADRGTLGMTDQQLGEEFNAGRMRSDWTWLAMDDVGGLVGRALWWGREQAAAPITLDVLDVAGSPESCAAVGRALLRAGQDALCVQGARTPLPYTLRLPTDWRHRSDSIAAVAWRQEALAAAGLTERNERLQVAWTPGASPVPHPGRLWFRPGSDEEFRVLFARVALGSLDVMTQRSLAVTTPEDLARDELDYYTSSAGERDWWRVATDASGDTVGFVIPSATPYARNVGYLGVLPQQRGHGHVDDLLAYVTGFHHAAGARRITATTDASNAPMAAAFARHGYRTIEVRIDFEPPAH